MSEKINFTKNQILDLGKISPVEKGWISHSILVALEKNLQGKDIKDIEDFYKNNINSESQKAILKISMEVEKNQIPEDRKKKWNYKIVYKTDNIDLSKLKNPSEAKKTEPIPENTEKVNGWEVVQQNNSNSQKPVENSEKVDNSETEVNPTSVFDENMATPVVVPIETKEENKNPFEMTDAEKHRREAMKTAETTIQEEKTEVQNPSPETENKTEIVLLKEEEAKQTILEILNTKNVNLNWINFLWLKNETKSREELAQSFVDKLKEEQWWKLIFSKEQIQTIFNAFIEQEENLNKTQTTKKVESLSSYLNEKYSLKATETYSNWITQETKNSEKLKKDINEKANKYKKSKLESDYLDISNTYKKLEASNNHIEKLIKILNRIWLNSNGLSKEDLEKITDFKDKATKDLWIFRENFLQATNIYKSIETEKQAETQIKPEEKKDQTENNSAKPLQANENKSDSSISWTEQEQKNNDKKIITNEQFLDLIEELNLDFNWIWKNEYNARQFFINEFKDYVLKNEKSFNYDYDDIKWALYSTYNNRENINFWVDNNNQEEIKKLYENLAKIELQKSLQEWAKEAKKEKN